MLQKCSQGQPLEEKVAQLKDLALKEATEGVKASRIRVLMEGHLRGVKGKGYLEGSI